MGREDTSGCQGLKSRIAEALRTETESGKNEIRLATLRLIDAAVRDRDVCARGRGDGTGCPDAAVRDVLLTLIEQLDESAAEHDREGRFDDALRERDEIAVIQEFLPAPLEGSALSRAAREVVEDLGASKLTDLGRCVTALKQRYPGRIEPADAGRAVREALSKP